MRSCEKAMAVIIMLVLAGWALAGCAAGLKPAPTAERVSGLKNAAQATVAGVQLVAQTSAWPGPVDIREKVTPLRVRIDNGSGIPLQVQYRDFAMIAPQGERFSALPPIGITGKVQETFPEPAFGYRNFELAPYWSPVYPGIPPYSGPYMSDPFYNRHYYSYMAGVSLPTPEMLKLALPEGVVGPGGSVEGWLYFQKVGDHIKQVDLRYDLVDAENGNGIAEIRIPFSVK